jgi:hypothetical protein
MDAIAYFAVTRTEAPPDHTRNVPEGRVQL